jgi:hypothetical protein
VKNGFPSARAYSSSTTRPAAGEPESSATCSATSRRDIGPSPICVTPPRSLTCASHSTTCGSSGASSERHVTTTAPPDPAGPGQERQAVEGRSVGPMHVLDDQRRGAPLGHRSNRSAIARTAGHAARPPARPPRLFPSRVPAAGRATSSRNVAAEVSCQRGRPNYGPCRSTRLEIPPAHPPAGSSGSDLQHVAGIRPKSRPVPSAANATHTLG